MRHIHTSIVSRHLAERGNNKILRTPPPHISSPEEILLRLTRRTLAQLGTNKSPFLKSYLHKVDAKTHPSPPYPLCNTHIHNTHHLFNCIHIRTRGLVDRPRRMTALLATEPVWWTTSEKIGLPPLARAKGVSRKQHKHLHDTSCLTIQTENNIHLIPYRNIHLQHSNAHHITSIPDSILTGDERTF